MAPSYQVVLWKQESFVVLRPLHIESFRKLLGINLLPFAAGDKSADARADESGDDGWYGDVGAAGADDARRLRTLVSMIDGHANTETGSSADGGSNERVVPTAPGSARGNLLNVGAGDSLVSSFGPDDEGIVGDGLEWAFDR